ncbi:MAG: PIG-L family deacetylase [Candidatus Omnitrophica bacterium]|nr:PIG-L family deacetylase [Candidatus Omnitrophota bacterium]
MDAFLKKQKCLVLAPHADDEVFGCGGTIAKMKDLGAEVYVIVVSVGEVVHYGPKSNDMVVNGNTRNEEFEGAMKYLKVDDYEVVFNDTKVHLRLDAIPRKDLVNCFERECKLSIDRIKPTMMILPAASYNQDHEAVFRAGFTACRPHLPDVKPFQKIVLSCDNPAISWSLEREKFHPTFYVDISKYLDKKLKAVSFHKSQMKPSIHHASLENIENLAKVRGREISVEAAEAFMCHRFVV